MCFFYFCLLAFCLFFNLNIIFCLAPILHSKVYNLQGWLISDPHIDAIPRVGHMCDDLHAAIRQTEKLAPAMEKGNDIH